MLINGVKVLLITMAKIRDDIPATRNFVPLLVCWSGVIESKSGKMSVLDAFRGAAAKGTKSCRTQGDFRSSVHLFVRPYVRSFVHPSIRPSVRPLVCPSVCPSIRPSVRPSVPPGPLKSGLKSALSCLKSEIRVTNQKLLISYLSELQIKSY